MRRFIGLTPVPPDADMATFIDSVISRDKELLEFILSELKESQKTTKAENQPENFTYGKLLRFIQSLGEADRVHLCSIALWTVLDQKEEIQVMYDQHYDY